MKKSVILSGIIFFVLILSCQAIFAQRYNRYAGTDPQDFCLLDLTDEQVKKIDALELEMEKIMEPIYSDLRALYLDLDDLEMQRNPDQTKIETLVDNIEGLEKKLDAVEADQEEKIMGLLTEEQRAQYTRYFGMTGTYGRGYYGRGLSGAAIGQGYYGRGMGRGIGRAGGYYGRGIGRGIGRAGGYYDRGIGRGIGRAGGYYDRGIGRGIGRAGGYYDRGIGRFDSRGYRSLRGVRYGRGPCGAGLGRVGAWGYGRFRR